jgi:hypothetical protein
MEGPEKTTKTFSRNSLCPGRDSNGVPPENKPEPLPIHKPAWFAAEGWYGFYELLVASVLAGYTILTVKTETAGLGLNWKV